MEERSQKGADDQRQNEFSVTYAGKEKDEIHRIQEKKEAKQALMKNGPSKNYIKRPR